MMQPSFDTWTSLFLFAALQGIFLSLILFFIKKESRYANRFLAMIVFLFSLTLFEYVLYWTRYLYYYPHFSVISAGFPFLFGPLLFFYLRYITGAQKINIKDLLHFIPFLTFTLYRLPYYLSSAHYKREIYTGAIHIGQDPFIQVIIWSRVVHLVIYFFLMHFTFRKKLNFSSEVQKWYRYIMIYYGGFVVSYSSYWVLIHFPFFDSSWDYSISFAMSFFILFIAWFGFLQPEVFNGFTIRNCMTITKYKSSSLTTSASKSLIETVNKMMTEKHVFEENELTLEKLAEMAGTTRHNLSQAINENTGLNFFDYINQFRIGEAKKLLSATSKKEYNIIDVAYAVGFNNKVSFNNTFKRLTGVTPTEFRKQYSVLQES